uniref:Uncharacterized protein n=1 Tax=Timema shepardi TaxID=629360 RepID=A0A7R9G1P0_TIMSH|nr:unnamed protein product [Timema shepardi]
MALTCKKSSRIAKFKVPQFLYLKLRHENTLGGVAVKRSPMASLVLTDSSQLTSDSQHLDIYLHFDCQKERVLDVRPFSGVEDYNLPDFLSTKEKEEIELSCDETLKSSFKKTSLADFWLQRLNEFPHTTDHDAFLNNISLC